MTDDAAADLGLVARQQRQLLAEMGTMRDDAGVMTAILQRLDGTVAGLVNEVRAMHSQHARLSNRVRDLEAQSWTSSRSREACSFLKEGTREFLQLGSVSAIRRGGPIQASVVDKPATT